MEPSFVAQAFLPVVEQTFLSVLLLFLSGGRTRKGRNAQRQERHRQECLCHHRQECLCHVQYRPGAPRLMKHRALIAAAALVVVAAGYFGCRAWSRRNDLNTRIAERVTYDAP